MPMGGSSLSDGEAARRRVPTASASAKRCLSVMGWSKSLPESLSMNSRYPRLQPRTHRRMLRPPKPPSPSQEYRWRWASPSLKPRSLVEYHPGEGYKLTQPRRSAHLVRPRLRRVPRCSKPVHPDSPRRFHMSPSSLAGSALALAKGLAAAGMRSRSQPRLLGLGCRPQAPHTLRPIGMGRAVEPRLGLKATLRSKQKAPNRTRGFESLRKFPYHGRPWWSSW